LRLKERTMAVRKTIFGSHSERELFVSIDSYWSTRGFVLYPSLPFASIFDITKLDVTPEEKSFLLKTSVDYTLCTKEGRPVVSVEFDGISHGFSRHGRYVAVRPAPRNDPRRAWKLDVKLRLATEEDYPLLVVSYHEKNQVAEDVHLTILDGMIGRVLAKREFSRRLQSLVDDHEEELAEVPPDDADEYIQNLAIGLEVEVDLSWNPIALASAETHGELVRRGLSSSHRVRYLDPPGVPDAPRHGTPGFVEAFKARVVALERATWVGCSFTYRTRLGDVSAEAWVRNTAHAGVTPLSLAEDVAGLLAGLRALKLADEERPQVSSDPRSW
jgi:hypothetical protein